MLQRNRAGGRQQRQAVLGTLALGLSQVHAADLSRVGGAFHPALYLGESILRETASQGEVCSPGHPLSCVQMDSYSLPVLEVSSALSRRGTPSRARTPQSQQRQELNCAIAVENLW